MPHSALLNIEMDHTSVLIDDAKKFIHCMASVVTMMLRMGYMIDDQRIVDGVSMGKTSTGWWGSERNTGSIACELPGNR